MRVLVIGATGAIGSRLVPQLIDRGHEVTGTFRSPGGAEHVRAMGARPARLDALDARAVRAVVFEAEPDAIVHQATALTGMRSLRNMDRVFAETNRLRTEGTDALLAAAWDAGVHRFVAQGNTTMYARVGGPVKTEEDPLDTAPPRTARQSAAAMRHLDATVTAAGGIVLRYGTFYGAAGDDLVEAVRRRMFPIVGDGGGVVSFIHLDDAAAATVLALEHGEPGVYNVVDDEPAPVREWLPALAEAVGAPPPRRVPRWVARALAGEFPVVLSTEVRGASNAKAKRELGWALRHPSWREGFAAAYGRAGAAAVLIEDKITPRALTAAGKPCLPSEEARMKIRAAVEAARESGIMILARTDCRPTAGIEEAVARIEMFMAEGAEIAFLDSPQDEDEIRRAVAAAKGRASFCVLSPGSPRATPTRARAEELGFKIGTYPTAMLSPAVAGIKAGLAALAAGEAEAKSALPPAELRETLGYGDYDRQAKRFTLSG